MITKEWVEQVVRLMEPVGARVGMHTADAVTELRQIGAAYWRSLHLSGDNAGLVFESVELRGGGTCVIWAQIDRPATAEEASRAAEAKAGAVSLTLEHVDQTYPR